MKKIVTALLILTLCVSLAACGGKKNDGATTTDAPVTTTAPETTAAPANGDVTPTVEENTVGGKHWATFVAEKTANPDITAEELAGKLVGMEINQFMGGTIPVEPGFLSGFENYEVTGFESGAMFCPMIGSIPFVGYVFDLADGADVDAFKKNLTDNANLRWQICVTADEMLCESNGDKVFFIMCPTSLEG